MNDLISRQAVMNALCDSCELFKNGEQTCRSKCEEYHFLATLPSVKNKGEWIPVSERLPEEEEEVLCQLSDDSCAVLYMQDNWGQMEWVDGQMGTGTYDVIAWRPLPEPYKGGE